MNEDFAKIRVLIIDGSALVRQSLSDILEEAGGFNVETASSPAAAEKHVEKNPPDVIVMDTAYPKGMDGFHFLKNLMENTPLPVVVCTGRSNEGILAMDAGAVSAIVKPLQGVQNFLTESSKNIVETVKEASRANLKKRRAKNASPPSAAQKPAVPPSAGIIVMGASTGGTEALREILEALPAAGPGIVVVQHMPEVYTAAFARRLNESCNIKVKEAADGDPVLAGQALIAPGNRHTLIQKHKGAYWVRVVEGPPINRHRPSVDVLFLSAAREAGADAVGVLLTGMGVDGAQGLLSLRKTGAMTIAQDEATSVVYGMPKAAAELGAAVKILSLSKIALRLSQGSAETIMEESR